MADENNQERSQAADAQVSSAAKPGRQSQKLPWVQRLVAFMELHSQLLKHQKMVGSYCWCPFAPSSFGCDATFYHLWLSIWRWHRCSKWYHRRCSDDSTYV